MTETDAGRIIDLMSNLESEVTETNENTRAILRVLLKIQQLLEDLRRAHD
jgi:hypothetical protein